MADEANKDAESAEKAYAAAAEARPVKTEAKKAAAPVSPEPESVKPAAPLKAALVKTTPKPTEKPARTKNAAKRTAKPAPKPAKAPAKAKTAQKPKPAARPLAAKPAKAIPAPLLPKKPAALKKPFFDLKETIMVKTPDFSKSMTDAVSELQTRAKAAYEKSTEVAGEMSEFAKGNVEALVESGKILSEGIQEMGKSCVEEAKSAYETATADLKEIAAIKSPTELFQLQGKLMRRNFDSLVAFGSKSSEAMVKLANESMAPLSSRMSVAAEKVSKAA